MKHLMCVDFESWIVSREMNRENLSFETLRKLDNGFTLKSLDYTLKLLKKYNVKTTFFVVFKLEDIFPGILKKIHTSGHEVAWHSYSHALINKEQVLKEELIRSKQLLTKYKVKGFQAPDIVFFKKGYSILKDAGFEYSSSIYGNSDMIYKFSGISELPVSTSNSRYKPASTQLSFPCNMSLKNIKKFGIPFGSSYFWSVLGKRYYAKKMKTADKEGTAVNLFIHNWQLIRPYAKSKKYMPNEQRGIFQNPLYTPYKINVTPLFESLLSQFEFQKCIDYVNSK